MRKTLIIVLIVGLVLTSGCIRKSIKSDNNRELSVNINKKTFVSTDVETSDNVFFFKNNISELKYKGNFLFDDIYEKEIKLNITRMFNLKDGILYELRLEPIEGVPFERLSLGYFYVLKDRIYKINATQSEIDQFKKSGKIPKNNVIVCQDKEIKDPLNKDEPGLHYYLEVKGDIRGYHSYNNQVSTGYYESFVWEKNKGLVNYRSGYGAERDSIELNL